MSAVRRITVHWPDTLNEKNTAMLWLGTWLVGGEGVEGTWFHIDCGGAVTEHDIPDNATGIRFRRWPSEGLAPEYADITPIESDTIDAATMPFERQQPFSMLTLD